MSDDSLMSPAASTQPKNRRWTADERRRAIVETAIVEFAQAGLAGASTETIARRAGISHAYVFRLFGTKHALFLAAIERGYDRLLGAFQAAAESHPGGAVPIQATLGRAYRELVADRTVLMFQLHAQAVAVGDPEVRATVRRRFHEVFAWVQREAGLTADEARVFMAVGALINVASAIDLPELDDHGTWERRITNLTTGAT